MKGLLSGARDSRVQIVPWSYLDYESTGDM